MPSRLADQESSARITALLPSWEMSLADRNLSPRTIEVYLRTGTQLAAWLTGSGLPDKVAEIQPAHLRAFIGAETARTSAVSAHQHWRNLNVLFRWLIREEEHPGPSPMDRVDAPAVARKVKPVLAAEQLAALLRECDGAGFEARRDTAILRVLIDSGVRVSGIANVELAHLDLRGKTVKIVLKGGDEHLVPLGRKAAAALDRYLRIRARHPKAESPWLWLGTSGRATGHLGAAGIQDMIQRRAAAAGLPKVTPHWFRRTFAHDWLEGGGTEADGMRIAGWKSRAMIEHYAGDLAAERARNAHARLSPGDRI